MNPVYDTDVLICGAGATGLTLAIELARRGVAFRLIEKLSDPFRGSRGKGIQPRTQEIVEDMGILDRLVGAGGIYPTQREYRRDGTHVDTDIAGLPGQTPAEPCHLALLIPQFTTEAVMRERLAELGGCAEFGCELLDIEQDARCVTATVAGSAGAGTIRARYLIGADGGHSFVRRRLDIGFPGKTLGVRALVADVELTGLSRDYWHRFNNDDMASMISFCPLPGTDLFQLQGVVSMEKDVDLSAEGLTDLVRARTGRIDVTITRVTWASVFKMNARLADRFRDGRVFLAGDAAHVHPPTGGQGLNTSVQDAYNLAWKLAAVLNGAPEILVESYEAERRPIAAQVLGLSTRLLEAAKKGRMERGREVHQLDLGYPNSSLSMEQMEQSGRSHGIRAGERAPDAPICGAAGQPTRLFMLFKGVHWTLLACDIPRSLLPATVPGLHMHHTGPQGDIVDTDGYMVEAYGLNAGEMVLIRPDGYIGAVFTVNEIDAFERYLRMLGLRCS